MLQDHYVGGQFMPAGSIQATADVGGLLPTGWKPTPNVDPQDSPAVTAFYNAGPSALGLVRTLFQGSPVAKPVTYWIRQPGGLPNFWVLTGLGQGLAAKFGIVNPP
jgi:hypothetical protein